MNSTDKRRAIADFAHQHGAMRMGVARAVNPPDATRHLDEWLSRRFHASMGWIARDPARRTDLDRLLPGVKSVLSFAFSYDSGEGVDPDKTGKISRYAWGADYHTVIEKKLEAIADQVRVEFPGASIRICVDSAPIMEKPLAREAGIGWIGKHTNLIIRNRGSWFFLGEILTDAYLEADEPEADHCGTCHRCIDACPTKAIVEPYILDANRCISYLTIEHRGEISAELANSFSGWMVGCDICQEVCPWNRFSMPSQSSDYAQWETNRLLSAEEAEAMTDKEFSDRFAFSAIKRVKPEGLRRNARIARRSMKKDGNGST